MSDDMLTLAERGALHMKHKMFNHGYDADGGVFDDGLIWFTFWPRIGIGVANRNMNQFSMGCMVEYTPCHCEHIKEIFR